MRIRKIRKSLKMSGTEVARKLGISAQHYYDIEKGENGLSAENAIKLSEIFEVSLNYLLGISINALIEDRLNELDMTYEDLSEITKIPEGFLRGLDTVPPQPWDYEKDEIIDRLANALKLDFNVLSTAFARQEPPGYDGPMPTVEESFEDVDFEENLGEKYDRILDVKKLKEEVKTMDQADRSLKSIGTNLVEAVEKELSEEDILTLAAHQVGHEGKLTEEQLAQIKLAVKIALAKDTE